jgi:hypothetical protein
MCQFCPGFFTNQCVSVLIFVQGHWNVMVTLFSSCFDQCVIHQPVLISVCVIPGFPILISILLFQFWSVCNSRFSRFYMMWLLGNVICQHFSVLISVCVCVCVSFEFWSVFRVDNFDQFCWKQKYDQFWSSSWFVYYVLANVAPDSVFDGFSVLATRFSI